MNVLLYFLKGAFGIMKFLEKYKALRDQGLSEKEIAQKLKMSLVDLRARRTIELNLKKGLTESDISKKFKVPVERILELRTTD